MTIQTLRIIDANSNRISEGLRFLEDIARFVLNDKVLSGQLKQIRHDIQKKVSKLGIQLISQRHSEDDVGTSSRINNKVQNVESLIIANAKRAEQGLRVIEELTKLPEISGFLDYKDFDIARFKLYTYEKRLLSSTYRSQKRSKLTGLYVILDSQIIESQDMIKAASKVISGGAKSLQLRDKCLPKKQLFDIAKRLRTLCHQTDTLFIINDHLDIVIGVDADGLHIGQEDLPVKIARRFLPIDKIIGCSVDNIKQALKAEREGADYIAVGAIYPTTTKQDARILGIECLVEIKRVAAIPVIAIGGINKDNVKEVLSTHVDSIAVASSILKQDNIEKSTREMVNIIEQKRKFNRKIRKTI